MGPLTRSSCGHFIGFVVVVVVVVAVVVVVDKMVVVVVVVESIKEVTLVVVIVGIPVPLQQLLFFREHGLVLSTVCVVYG